MQQDSPVAVSYSIVKHRLQVLVPREAKSEAPKKQKLADVYSHWGAMKGARSIQFKNISPDWLFASSGHATYQSASRIRLLSSASAGVCGSMESPGRITALFELKRGKLGKKFVTLNLPIRQHRPFFFFFFSILERFGGPSNSAAARKQYVAWVVFAYSSRLGQLRSYFRMQ